MRFRNPLPLLLLLLVPLLVASRASALVPVLAARQSPQSDAAEIRQLARDQQWTRVVAAVPDPAAHRPTPAADLLLLRALAEARLKRLDAAAQTLRLAARAYPRDARFPTELAGVLYSQKQYAAAAHALRHALHLDPANTYARTLLGNIDFLSGNLAAALADWNLIQRPVLDDQQIAPRPNLAPLLLDRIFPFTPGGVLTLRQYRITQAQLALQPLFVATSDELRPTSDGHFDRIVHTIAHPSWRGAPIAAALSTLRSLPYQAVDPELWNLRRSAVSLTTYLRWDAQKRMILANLGSPIHSPDQRLSFLLDARNENWNLTRTLTPVTAQASGVHPATGLNQETIVTTLALDELFANRLLWQSSAAFSRRRFRSLQNLPTGTSFFVNTSGLSARVALTAPLLELPADGFDVAASLAVEATHYFTQPLGNAERLTGAVDAHWRVRRNTVHAQLRAGNTFGAIPFDQLWMLGFDRDNPLWMRGHNGLVNGRKGNAPLGTRYLLSNTDLDRQLWRDPFVTLRAGAFLDTGRIVDSESAQLFGSPRWLTDTGVQARLHFFTGAELTLGWGHDIRSGGNSFYSTISH